MSQKPLRVSIYRNIPDLAGDELAGLKQFIVSEFKKEIAEPVDVVVDATVDPYNEEKLKSTYLTDGDDAYDVMELETTNILKNLATTGHLQALDGLFDVNANIYTPSAVDSVKCAPEAGMPIQLYGVPTLQCASFLMELADTDFHAEAEVLQDWHSIDEIESTLDHSPSIPAFDLRGTWGFFEYFYTNAKVYMVPYCQGAYSFQENQKCILEKVAHLKHVVLYGFSENLAETLQASAKFKKCKQTLKIITPPLDKPPGHILTYTDAVVVNRKKFAHKQKAVLIKKFVNFYTSLAFRNKVAFGWDLPQPIFCPRYLLPAREDFFTKTAAAKDEKYQMFHKALSHSLAAPTVEDHIEYYAQRDGLEKKMEKVLGIVKFAEAKIE